MRSLRHVLWDWNGTLLDDVELCVRLLNVLCERRGMRAIDREEYARKFTFPVMEYYRAVGFDLEKEPFEGPAREWVALYARHLYEEARLHEGVEEVLARVRSRGLVQSILSAHHRDMLAEAVARFGVDGYFDAILGIENHYAESKLAIGRHWMESSGAARGEVALIGDTLHDWEVAEALGIRCVLIHSGHQSRARLEGAGVPVLESIREVPAFLESL